MLVHQPLATVRVAPLYQMCGRVAYLCVAFLCHIAKVCEKFVNFWMDFSVWTLIHFSNIFDDMMDDVHHSAYLYHFTLYSHKHTAHRLHAELVVNISLSQCLCQPLCLTYPQPPNPRRSPSPSLLLLLPKWTPTPRVPLRASLRNQRPLSAAASPARLKTASDRAVAARDSSAVSVRTALPRHGTFSVRRRRQGTRTPRWWACWGPNISETHGMRSLSMRGWSWLCNSCRSPWLLVSVCVCVCVGGGGGGVNVRTKRVRWVFLLLFHTHTHMHAYTHTYIHTHPYTHTHTNKHTLITYIQT